MSSSSPNPFRYRLEHKKTKDFEKEDKIKAIKKELDDEFQEYITEQPDICNPKTNINKLKIEYNKLLFQNMCKQKQIKDLQSYIKSTRSLRRNSSNGAIEAKYYLRSEDYSKEINNVLYNLQIEIDETHLLDRMKQKEKNTIKQLEEKINDIYEKQDDLNKYTEKVTRTGALADNLYEKTSKSLNTSRKCLTNDKSSRKNQLKNLKNQEWKLSNQIKHMENDFTHKIYNNSVAKTRVNFITTKIETLVKHSYGTRNECEQSMQYIKNIENKIDVLQKLIKSSKFIFEEPSKKIVLEDMGKYLNMLIFSESQLQLRYSELIKMQSLYKGDIKSLKNEFEDIKSKFKDSEFIENWNTKLTARQSQYVVKKPEYENVSKKPLSSDDVYDLEKIGILSLKTVLEMFNHLRKLVEEINSFSLEKIENTESLSRQRTLSCRFTIDTLPVLSEESGSAYFYQFRETVKNMLLEKYKQLDDAKIDDFLKLLVNDYMIKNFLSANNFADYLEGLGSSQEVFSKYYMLYEPAHDSLRKKILKCTKSMLSFVTGVNLISEQILTSFDNNSLSELQIDKIIAMNPKVTHNSRLLKDVIKNVVKYRAGDMPKEFIKKMIKKKKVQRVKDYGTITEVSDEEKRAEKMKRIPSKQIVHARAQSQREIKSHLEEISTMLVKSKRVKFH
ncbi:hypothetical protein SteCoe_30345 [Stentor coeruleus]|uniref:Uncharacterized protein n=1 Tax=Stentor coeruleus TaxID=5963 RepID=A0A1R2B3X1_9CILI|nr:hypothetical protein SteCoe_30345 [Stentor coeruleus]